MYVVCSTNQMTSFHCTHPPQSSRLDRLNKPHMMSVGGYSLRADSVECDPPCCVEIIFFLASLSLAHSPHRAFQPFPHSSPIIELVERGGRERESKAMYNSGNTIINLSDSKRIDGAKGDGKSIRPSPVGFFHTPSKQ